jgi:hypothetical protein
VKQVQLHNRGGDVVGYALVDDEDYERVMAAGRWSLSPRGCVYRRETHRKVQREVKLHRFIMGFGVGDPMIDHEDRDPLNNTKANLRPANNVENGQNLAPVTVGRSSPYRGVSWQKDIGRWRAQAMINGKHYHIASCATAEEANEAAKAWRAIHMPFSEEARRL